MNKPLREAGGLTFKNEKKREFYTPVMRSIRRMEFK